MPYLVLANNFQFRLFNSLLRTSLDLLDINLRFTKVSSRCLGRGIEFGSVEIV